VTTAGAFAVLTQKRDSSHHRTQTDAIDAGRETAQRERTELVIHGRDGRIRDSDSFGPTPVPTGYEALSE